MLSLLKKYQSLLYPLVLILASLLTYLTNYGYPKTLFWDENYHIASAQKHIDGVMYMEPHPPLGKMLMALGDVLVTDNDSRATRALVTTDYVQAQDLPEGFSYWGFRLPSALLMALSVGFFYGIVVAITRHRLVAAVFTSFIIFDNAFVVHSRAAMLEGIQLFFMLAAIYYFVRIATSGKAILLKHYAWLGLLIGLTVAVKVNGAILLLLLAMLFFIDQWKNIKAFEFFELIKRLIVTVPAGTLPVIAVFLTVFYVHIGTGKNIIDNRTYKASAEYLTHIHNGTTFSLGAFTTGLRDNLRYMSEYADGVPRLDVCKPGENGSHVSSWPLGGKTISYRWGKDTYEGVVKTNYTYLVANPIVWLSALAGIILSTGLIMSRFIYGNNVKDPALFNWICGFTLLYLAYMITMLNIERVMYLYHYLVPLTFALINLALVFTYIFREPLAVGSKHTLINLCAFGLLVFLVFAFFSPLTYSIPITADQFDLRDWFSIWKMEVIR